MEEITIDICFQKFINFQVLYKNEEFGTLYWFSWTMFGKTYYSKEFDSSTGPFQSLDKIQLQIPSLIDGEFIPSDFLEGFQLSVFLCNSHGKILVGNPYITMFDNVRHESFPVKSTKIILLEYDDDKSIPQHELPQFQMSVDLLKIRQPNNTVAGEEDMDTYENDFENDEEISGHLSPSHHSEVPSHSPPYPQEHQKSVHFHIPNASVLTSPDDLKLRDLIRSVEALDDGRRSQSEWDSDRTPRDMIITVQIQSVRGLAHTAEVYYRVLYPHFGAPDVLRNKPKLVFAHMTGELDRKHVQFRALICPAELRKILSAHPLRVEICNKDTSGDGELGVVDIDLMAVLMNNQKLTYQSPSGAGKKFQSLEAYQKYRDTLSVFEEPIIIRAMQTTDIPFKRPPKSRSARFETKGTLTVLVKIEDRGPTISNITAVPVQKGYSLQGGALYHAEEAFHFEEASLPAETDGATGDNVADVVQSSSTTHTHYTPHDVELEMLKRQLRSEHEEMVAEWERFRATSEVAWRAELQQKERDKLHQVEADCIKKLANDADSLQRAKEECNKQELHLKREIQKREADQARCDREELKRTAAYEQKMGALRLMERRARDEAATKVQKKQNEVDALSEKLKQLEIDLKEARERTRDAEKAHDAYIARSKKFPETVLREENAILKAQLEVIRAEVERERRHVAEESMKTLRAEQRIADLLRKIGYLETKMADTARMEMDQLRLQFMAREERYMLDGDREELRNIKNEMSALKTQQLSGRGAQTAYRPKDFEHRPYQPQPDQQFRREMQQHDAEQEEEQQLRDSLDLGSSEHKVQSPPRQAPHRPSTAPPTVATTYTSAYQFTRNDSMSASSLGVAKNKPQLSPKQKADQELHRRSVVSRRNMLRDVCAGGLYDPASLTDPLVVQLRQQIEESERNLVACGGRLEDL